MHLLVEFKWHKFSVSGEYFSGDTVVTTIDNKTKPIQDLKLFDQVLVDSDLVSYETHLSTNNFKIDSTWQRARFEFLGNVITLAKPEREFIGKGITENSKGGTFLGEKIVTIQQILTAVHKFKQFSIKQHDQSIHCFNSMLSTGHQI